MHWYNLPPGWVNLVIAAVIGYSIALAIAVFKSKAGERVAFIKEKGLDLMVVTLVAIPASALTSLALWVPLYFVLTNIFSVAFDREARLSLFALISVLVFVSTMLCYAYHITKED
jgi:hypothetical protein